MAPNGYEVLGFFLCLIRLFLAGTVVLLGIPLWHASRRTLHAEQKQSSENDSYLLFLLIAVLIGLNVASWPVLYLVLQSYVQEWPEIMCIYGVTKIGADSIGISRYLPGLLTGLFWLKPLLVFASGASLVLYFINRRCHSPSAFRNTVAAFLFTGVLTISDSLTECSYLSIPMAETRIEGGCCIDTLESLRRDSQFQPRSQLDEHQKNWLNISYFSLNLAIILGLLARLQFRTASLKWDCPFYVCGLLAVPVSYYFLIETAAPAILRLPFHNCPYDLITAAPESVLTIVLFLSGLFSLGWSSIAAYFGSRNLPVEQSQDLVSKLRFVAWFGYAGSLLLMTIELHLA